jgi:solute carrier family 25 protein 46
MVGFFQGISSMWKGLGSALTVRGLVMAVEDCTGKFTPWPVQVDSTSSLRMVGQHLLLKAVSQAIVVPFFSASLVESVQSDIASEKPGIFDFLKEGLLRLGPQSGSRTLPIYLLVSSLLYSIICNWYIEIC